MRLLDETEAANDIILKRYLTEYVLVHLTATGWNKSIMDATASLRELFARSGLHDYVSQQQGNANKIRIPTTVLGGRGRRDSTASVYRPSTKHGDPRFWVDDFRRDIDPGGVFAVAVHAGRIIIVVLTGENLDQSPHQSLVTLEEISRVRRSTVERLLLRIRSLVAQPVPADGAGDTAVGRTLETLLGIRMNGRKGPDIDGIELKSSRRKRGKGTRLQTIFAQVPDWDLSELKSSREILDTYGYVRDGKLRLNCTVGPRVNRQGLWLHVDEAGDFVHERSARGAVATWRLERLRRHLASKHRATFWVSATELQIDGRTYFQYESINFTEMPNIYAFGPALSVGELSVDHLMNSTADGGCEEKGPLFRATATGMFRIFGKTEQFLLR